MSVQLKLTGYCKECEYIDLELDYFRTDFLNNENKKHYTLKCRHEPTCYRMQEEHKKAMEEIDKALTELCDGVCD